MSNLNSNAQRMEDIIEGKQKKSAPKYIAALIALVLLAACSFGAYSIGQSSGHTAGYDEGYSTGCEEGRKAGNLLKSQALIKKSYRQKKSIAKQRRQNGSLGRLK